MKTELKNSKHVSHTIPLSQYIIFVKMVIFLAKNADISKVMRILILKATFSETKYVCVLT